MIEYEEAFRRNPSKGFEYPYRCATMKFPTTFIGYLTSGYIILTDITQVFALSVQTDLYDRAVKLMESSPLIDTHVDLPQVLRSLSKDYLLEPTPLRSPVTISAVFLVRV